MLIITPIRTRKRIVLVYAQFDALFSYRTENHIPIRFAANRTLIRMGRPLRGPGHPNLRANRRTVPCTICSQRAWASVILWTCLNYNRLSTHFRKNQFKMKLQTTLCRKSCKESYAHLYAELHA
jgi:hypothetical protein